MMDPTVAASGAELAAVVLPRGRGYRTDAVDAWRETALALVGDLESLASDLRAQIVDAQRTSAQAGGPTIDTLLAHLSPDDLRRAGAVAAGEALVAAMETARSVLVRANEQAAAHRARVLDAIRAAEQVVAEGRHPDYDLHRLAIELSAARRALEGDQPPAPSAAAVPGSLADTTTPPTSTPLSHSTPGQS